MQKIGEDNPKARKINQTLNQVPTPRPEYDKNLGTIGFKIPSKSMLKRV